MRVPRSAHTRCKERPYPLLGKAYPLQGAPIPENKQAF